MKRESKGKDWNPPVIDEGSDSPINPLSFDRLGRNRGPSSSVGIVTDSDAVTDPDGLERAWARYRAPQKLKELKEAKEALSKRIDALETDAVKKSELRRTPREEQIKNIFRKLRVKLSGRSQQKLAALVDEHLKGINKKLADVCPKTWIALGLPTHLEDVFKSPRKYPAKLLRNVKSYISKSV